MGRRRWREEEDEEDEEKVAEGGGGGAGRKNATGTTMRWDLRRGLDILQENLRGRPRRSW